MQPRRPVLLVVDDDPAVRLMLGHVLTGAGFEVRAVASGQEAVEAYGRQPAAVAAVLIDVMMPGIDGFTTLTALRRLNPDVRCCLMTAAVPATVERRLREHGPLRLVTKPFRFAELVQTVQETAGV